MTGIVLSDEPANAQAPPRKTKGLSVEVTVFSNRYPTGKRFFSVARVTSYRDFERSLYPATVVTIIVTPGIIGLAPLPADVFQTVVAALTVAVVAEVRAKHSLTSGSPMHDVTMTERAGR